MPYQKCRKKLTIVLDNVVAAPDPSLFVANELSGRKNILPKPLGSRRASEQGDKVAACAS